MALLISGSSFQRGPAIAIEAPSPSAPAIIGCMAAVVYALVLRTMPL